MDLFCSGITANSRLERDGCFLRIRRHRKRGSRGSLLCRFRFLTWPPGTAVTYLGITKKRIWCSILLCAVAGYACFSGRCRKGRLSGAGKRSIPSQCTKERILLPRPDRAAAGEKENGKWTIQSGQKFSGNSIMALSAPGTRIFPKCIFPGPQGRRTDICTATAPGRTLAQAASVNWIGCGSIWPGKTEALCWIYWEKYMCPVKYGRIVCTCTDTERMLTIYNSCTSCTGNPWL